VKQGEEMKIAVVLVFFLIGAVTVWMVKHRSYRAPGAQSAAGTLVFSSPKRGLNDPLQRAEILDTEARTDTGDINVVGNDRTRNVTNGGRHGLRFRAEHGDGNRHQG
jgi:hypothetical protein